MSKCALQEVLVQGVHVGAVRLLKTVRAGVVATNGSLAITRLHFRYRTRFQIFGSWHDNGEGLLVLDKTIRRTHDNKKWGYETQLRVF